MGHKMQGRIEHPRYRWERPKERRAERNFIETGIEEYMIFERYLITSPMQKPSDIDEQTNYIVNRLMVLLYYLSKQMPEIVERDKHLSPPLPTQEEFFYLLMSLSRIPPARELMETARDDYIRMYEETRLNLR